MFEVNLVEPAGASVQMLQWSQAPPAPGVQLKPVFQIPSSAFQYLCESSRDRPLPSEKSAPLPISHPPLVTHAASRDRAFPFASHTRRARGGTRRRRRQRSHARVVAQPVVRRDERALCARRRRGRRAARVDHATRRQHCGSARVFVLCDLPQHGHDFEVRAHGLVLPGKY